MINPYKSRKKTVPPLVVKPNFPVTKIPPSHEEMMINPYELEEIETPMVKTHSPTPKTCDGEHDKKPPPASKSIIKCHPLPSSKLDTKEEEEKKLPPIKRPSYQLIPNPYKKKLKVADPSTIPILLLHDSPPMCKPRANRDKLHLEVIRFTELVNKIYGSNDVPPEPVCPWCFVTDNLSTDRRLTGKCWHRFGKSLSCADCCYGCGVPMNGCDSGGNERCCTEALYIHDSMNITLEESDINKVPLVCKSCLRPCNSYSECVFSHGCWNSCNKYFVWRFCHIAGRALVYSQLKPNCKGPGTIPKHAQDIIKNATELMYNELRDPMESSQYTSPFCHVLDQDSWSKWLVSMSFGRYYNYMPFFRHCYTALMSSSKPLY